MLIGYWGCPPKQVMRQMSRRHPYDEFIDLDVDMNAPESHLVPEAFCQIITNIVDNAVSLHDELRLVVAAVGEDKCDGGRFAALILRDLGFQVVEVRNMNEDRLPISIATSRLPLREKVDRIMDTVRKPNRRNYRPVKPTHGYWGVAPHDMGLLDLFPATTHVYGWTRCVEAGVPANLELEMHVDPGVPTVFYAQTFCAKTSIARYLADKYDGLYLDCDGPMTRSVMAQVEAFLRLG